MRGRASALAALLVATAGAAGCGGSNGSGNDAVPTAAGGDGQTDTTSAATTSDSTSREDAMVRFTRCLRDHGIQVSESSSGGKTNVRVGGPGQGSRGKMNAAMQACQKYAPSGGGNLDPQQRQQFLDQARAFARCMRDHGQDVPDPQVTGNGGVSIRIGRPGMLTPAFKSAQQACQSKLPKAAQTRAGS
jgi:hypothetical protein